MNRIPPTLDMSPDGSFRRTPPAGPPLSLKLLVVAVLVAMVAAAVSVAALALWVVSLMLPVLILAGAAVWGLMAYRRWQVVRGARDLRR